MGKAEEKRQLEDLDLDIRIIVIFIFKNCNRVRMNWIDLAQVRFCE